MSKSMLPIHLFQLLLIFGIVYAKRTINIPAPIDRHWAESKAKGCAFTDFNGPIVNVGNFTTYGLTLHDFNEKTLITVNLNNSASFYQFKNVRMPLKTFELKYDNFLMNNTLIWNSYREYRKIFQKGFDANDKETAINVEGEKYYVTIIPTLTLKRDGTIKFINYVAASSSPEPDDNIESNDVNFRVAENKTEASENVNLTAIARRKSWADSFNYCAEVCVHVSSIDITL